MISCADVLLKEETKLPEEYPPFDPLPASLLSRIYRHLDLHIERQSARTINAIFAFILTTVSHEYLQQVSRSVGYSTDGGKNPSRVSGAKPNIYPLDDEDGEDKDNDLFEPPDSLWDAFPDFFPQDLLDILPAAQKSLVLLQAAQPDHPLLHRTTTHSVIRWFWTKDLIESAWNGLNTDLRVDNGRASPQSEPSSSNTAVDDKAAFSLFRLFDLEPGSKVDSPKNVKEDANAQSLQSFINSFPESLPPITPTLSHLTSLVMAQLVQHASTLSNALLTLFLSPSDNLNFQAHLHLLRSYLLLTSPPFKSRLAAAVFSDSEDFDHDHKAYGISIRSLRRKPGKKPGESTQPWAVGIAPSLLERETWPPVGADLSFFLRTVIVDSFETGKDSLENYDVGRQVLEEAEYRLGFAIRDLPIGSGGDKWLNPLCTYLRLRFNFRDADK